MRKRNNIPIGTVFTRLTVVGHQKTKSGRSKSVCKCSCGALIVVRNNYLKTGDTASCGCLRRDVARANFVTHGATRNGRRTRAFTSWSNMKTRCGVGNHPDYAGRGITVCERWQKFENFLADMGECPPGLSIDRINNDGNYEPGNCRWATRSQQNRNTRVNTKYTVLGFAGCFSDLCDHFGISQWTAKKRRQRGWSIERIFTEPTHRKNTTFRSMLVHASS